MSLLRALLGALALVMCLSWPRSSSAAPASAPRPAAADCDVIHGLTALDRTQRERLHRACIDGPQDDAATYTALFRLVSSSGWHAGVVGTMLRRHGRDSLTAWAEGRPHDAPAALVAQEKLDAGLSAFAAGTLCKEFRDSEALAEFLDAVGADEPPESLPFTSRFATCLGVPASTMESIRLLTIRADGLEDVTVVVGTRDYVHAQRWTRADALRLDGHRFFVAAVPEASPVVVLGTHENQALPVVWRGLVTRNEVVWAAAPRRSCLDLSVRMNPDTRLYFDGVRIDDGPEEEVCAAPTADATTKTDTDDPLSVDRTLAITLDQPGSGLPEHEISALTCEGRGTARRPVVRHLSPLPATAPADQLRAAGLCEAFRLDLGTPTKQRVAVLGVNKLPGCEATPLWASDVPERVRHVIGRDVAHRDARTYTNFSAYAEASEALSSLETRLGGRNRSDANEREDADANALLGTAAQEAWRQGIDTLLSFTMQCMPHGSNADGEPQWSYSIRATSIHVSGLFARGYYGRDGLDLEDFINVESVGFDTVEQQDAAIGALLDRTFGVTTPRFVPPPDHEPYRRPLTLRLSGWSDDPPGAAAEPGNETIELRYKSLYGVGEHLVDVQARRVPGSADRPAPCEMLVARGARLPEATAAAASTYESLPTKERRVVFERSRDDEDVSSDPRATVHKGEIYLPRPGWYLVTTDADQDGELDDAVCVDATSHSIDVWADLAPSGGPLAFASNGSRIRLYTRARVGMTRYFRGGWLGTGVSLGYGFTDYVGPRADWKDLDVASREEQQWRRHALLLSPHLEFRSRTRALPVEFRARLGPAIDTAMVDARRVDYALVEFRAGNDENAILDIDVDANLELSMGVPVGRIQIDIMTMLSHLAVDDSLVRSATTVVEDANMVLGFGLMISGGVR
ncbi:hypothetical protein [Paraliomyxa miuraensis]|uniref:hypothetical protein n=1 Tax=Paraliomyxa miuraensis TaxID=376150 RepID=UPI002259534E|nr:hypothetical protein [Paraliomyxa miuraensis]MCX4247182.1 hypothetical protein [Paraliomyxa miuraensis]